MDALFGAPLHLLEVAVVHRGYHHGLYVGMLFVYLIRIEVAGNARLVELVGLLSGSVLRAGGDPVELLVVEKRLVVLAGMAVSHAHHRDLYRFHLHHSFFFLTGLRD